MGEFITDTSSTIDKIYIFVWKKQVSSFNFPLLLQIQLLLAVGIMVRAKKKDFWRGIYDHFNNWNQTMGNELR
jgi:hypothetical protein